MVRTSLAILSAVTQDGAEDYAADARVRYKADFPGRSARRMTHLGLLVDLVARGIDIEDTTTLIYASAFAESCSLEDFIDSFPHASPMGFQTSIHPSAIEQSLILRKRPVRRFFPLTSSRNLAGQALENALLLGGERVAIVGGEEKGKWLTPFGLASDRSFAFSLELGEADSEGVGKLGFEAAELSGNETPVELPELYAAIAERKVLKVASYAMGGWLHLSWK